MKIKVLGTLMGIVASFLTYAMEVETHLNLKTGETSALIKNPIHNSSNFSFALQSTYEADAICRYLGYERFVRNSVELGDTRTDVIYLNSDGTVRSAPIDYPIVEIMCINNRPPQLMEKSVVIENPFHFDVKIPFYVKTEADAQSICKYLGHDRFALNSIERGDEVTNVLVLNSDGTIRSALRDYPVSRIVCLDKL